MLDAAEESFNQLSKAVQPLVDSTAIGKKKDQDKKDFDAFACAFSALTRTIHLLSAGAVTDSKKLSKSDALTLKNLDQLKDNLSQNHKLTVHKKATHESFLQKFDDLLKKAGIGAVGQFFILAAIGGALAVATGGAGVAVDAGAAATTIGEAAAEGGEAVAGAVAAGADATAIGGGAVAEAAEVEGSQASNLMQMAKNFVQTKAKRFFSGATASGMVNFLVHKSVEGLDKVAPRSMDVTVKKTDFVDFQKQQTIGNQQSQYAYVQQQRVSFESKNQGQIASDVNDKVSKAQNDLNNVNAFLQTQANIVRKVSRSM